MKKRTPTVDRWLVANADNADFSTPPESRRPPDPGLAQIDDLERLIVLAKEQSWTWNGASADEIALFLPAVKAQARAVCDRLREEYLARRSQRS